MQVFLYWLKLLWLKLRYRRASFNSFYSEKKVLILNPNVKTYLSRYFCDSSDIASLAEVSWADLIFRRYVFVGLPKKESTNKFKRIFIKFFYPNTSNIRICNLMDAIFQSPSNLVMFTPGHHVVEMFQIHFAHNQVFQISDFKKSKRNIFIYILAKISKRIFLDQEAGRAVFANLVDPFLLKAYRTLHPNKKVILRLHDRYSEITKNDDYLLLRNTIRSLLSEKVIDIAESYYQKDAERLEIVYRPNGVNLEFMKTLKRNTSSYLYSFIGGASRKSRLEEMSEVRQKIRDLYPGVDRFICELQFYKTSDFITYREYLDILAQSEVIVDLYRISPDEGWSYRIPEALALQKKIITNRCNLQNQDFYHPSRFFIIGYDPITRLKEFLEAKYEPVSQDIKDKINTRYWWNF